MLKLKSVIVSFVHDLKTVDGMKKFHYKTLADLSYQDWVLIEGYAWLFIDLKLLHQNEAEENIQCFIKHFQICVV